MGELLSGNHLAVLGLMLAVLAFVVHRAVSRNRGSSRNNPLQDMKASFTRIEQSVPGRLLQAEVRLHEVARDAEARIETRMLVLDQMILSADREIRRLQDKLNELNAPNASGAGSGQSPDELKLAREVPIAGGSPAASGSSALGQTILALAARGMSPEIIADMTGQPIARIIALIEAARPIDRRNAA